MEADVATMRLATTMDPASAVEVLGRHSMRQSLYLTCLTFPKTKGNGPKRQLACGSGKLDLGQFSRGPKK